MEPGLGLGYLPEPTAAPACCPGVLFLGTCRDNLQKGTSKHWFLMNHGAQVRGTAFA